MVGFGVMMVVDGCSVFDGVLVGSYDLLFFDFGFFVFDGFDVFKCLCE